MTIDRAQHGDLVVRGDDRGLPHFLVRGEEGAD